MASIIFYFGRHYIKDINEMVNSKPKCPCEGIKLPRWDIYICDYCGRQLAFLENPVLSKHLADKFIPPFHPIFWCGVTVGFMTGGLFMTAIRIFE